MKQLEEIEAQDLVNQYYEGGISISASDSHFQFVRWMYEHGYYVGDAEDNPPLKEKDKDELLKNVETPDVKPE